MEVTAKDLKSIQRQTSRLPIPHCPCGRGPRRWYQTQFQRATLMSSVHLHAFLSRSCRKKKQGPYTQQHVFTVRQAGPPTVTRCAGNVHKNPSLEVTDHSLWAWKMGEFKHLVIVKFKGDAVVDETLKGLEKLVSEIAAVKSFEWWASWPL